MLKPLRVGVIGCGRVTALRHLPALSRLDDAEVVALADSDAARLKQVADRFHITNRYPDVRALLKDAMVDVIAVRVPAQFHADIALAALDAGKHVFIEKPLTVTLEEADRVHDRAKQFNRKVWWVSTFDGIVSSDKHGPCSSEEPSAKWRRSAPCSRVRTNRLPGGKRIVPRAEVRSSIRQFTSLTFGDSC